MTTPDNEPQKFPFISVIYVDERGGDVLERQHVAMGPVPVVGDHVCLGRERPWVVTKRLFHVDKGSVTITLTK